MPRPTKEFLDYFPMYCRGDERTDILKAKKGMTGFGVYISLLIKLYGEKGYYLNWNDTVRCIFSNNVGVPEDEVSDIISLLINIGIFDKDIYERHSVLTSKEIQVNYLFAVTKRKNKELDKRFDLVSSEETRVYGEETRVSVTESTQIKEKKIKEKKIKEKNIKEKESREAYPPPAPSAAVPVLTPTPRGEMNNVFLTEEEYGRLKAKCTDVDALIDRLSLYIASTGKEYSSHYATLVRWAEEDREKQTKTKAASPQKESSFDIDEFYRYACAQDFRSCLT